MSLCTRIGALILTVCAYGAVSTYAQEILHVDDDASLGGDGTAWSTAYKYLQDALAIATAGDEIRIAGGLYKPDQDETAHVTLGDRFATFQLQGGVTLLGGYAGLAEPANPEIRDIHLYETILSGDLAGNDVELSSRFAWCFASPLPIATDCREYDLDDDDDVGLRDAHTEENSCKVVTAAEIQETAALDGLTITAAGDDGEYPANGGALYIRDATLKVTNCSFRHNFAEFAGAVYVKTSWALTFEKCTFEENGTSGMGGALEIWRGDPTLVDCAFRDNSAFQAGAVDILSGHATLAGCTFHGNCAWQTGGAIMTGSDPVTITKSVFKANRAERGSSGAVLTNDAVITDCVFAGNRAGG